MKLPSWLGKHVPKPEVSYEVADSIHTAPGYRVVGDDFYTCIRPADVPHDPVWERIVHEFDPGAIFCWRKKRFMLPNSTTIITVTHNALARYVQSPSRSLRLFHVEMPWNAKHPKPNELLWISEKCDDTYKFEGGPGAYMPWTGEITRYLRKDFLNKTVKELTTDLERRERAKISREEAFARDEAAYKNAQLQAFIRAQLAKPGDTEKGYRDYMRMATSRYQSKKAFAQIRRSVHG